ncbi:MAG: histidinol-phosphate transaminase [Nitrososphaerales archaeon]
MSKWVRSRVSILSKISGYEKPERYANATRLDTNENLALPKEFIVRIMNEASGKTDPREYPTYQYDELRRALARYLNLSERCISIGSGSDQIIDLLLSIFNNNSSTITVKPSFTFYKDRCSLRSVKIKELSLNRYFSFNPKKLRLIEKGARICYLCSPNNPTGNQFDKQRMLDVISSFSGLVIVDEAYVEFADYSLKDLVKKYENLVVLRTMSKAFGLAGARVGYMVSSSKIADLFVKTIQYPYPVGSLSLKAACIALSQFNYIKSVIKKVRNERNHVIDNINSINGLYAFRSDANFVLFEAGKRYQTFHRNLIKRGVVVRDIGNIGDHKGCLRVTIGTPKMNNKFLKTLKVVSR